MAAEIVAHFVGFVGTPPGAIMVAALALVIAGACYDLRREANDGR